MSGRAGGQIRMRGLWGSTFSLVCDTSSLPVQDRWLQKLMFPNRLIRQFPTQHWFWYESWPEPLWGKDQLGCDGVFIISCPVKFHQQVLWPRRRTLVWRQSRSHGKKFPRVREMVSSATIPYFTKLKMERISVSVLIAKLKTPQAPHRCYGQTCHRDDSHG